MHHEEQECCILTLCCGSLAKRVEALAGLLRDAAPGPDKFGDMAAILWERKLVRRSSVFVAPAFAVVEEVAGFLSAYSHGPDKYAAMASALFGQGYVVSLAELLWEPVLVEVREGLECLGIPYDGEQVTSAPAPVVEAVEAPKVPLPPEVKPRRKKAPPKSKKK